MDFGLWRCRLVQNDRPNLSERSGGFLTNNKDINCLRYARPAEARPEARGQMLKFLLKIKFTRLKTPGFFSGFFRRSFCTYRELQKPKSDHVHPGFSYFFPFLTPQKSHENPSFPFPLQNPFSWDHAQMIERKILFRIALTRALYDQIRP